MGKESRRIRPGKGKKVVLFGGNEGDINALREKVTAGLEKQTTQLTGVVTESKDELIAVHNKGKEEVITEIHELRETLLARKSEEECKKVEALKKELEEKEATIQRERDEKRNLLETVSTQNVVIQTFSAKKAPRVPETVSIGDKTAATPTSLDSTFASTAGSVPKAKHEALRAKVEEANAKRKEAEAKAKQFEKENIHINLDLQDRDEKLRSLHIADVMDVPPKKSSQTARESRAESLDVGRKALGRRKQTAGRNFTPSKSGLMLPTPTKRTTRSMASKSSGK